MVKKHTHGGDIYAAAKQLNCHPSEIIDFSANINIVAPTVALPLTQKLISSYGDPRYRALRKAIAERYRVKPKEIALFNGASSAIMELFKTLQPQETYLYTPIYSEYVKASKLYSQKTHLINRFYDLYTPPEKGSTVAFVNPSTPDGRYYDLERLFSIWKEAKCTIIVDESFLEFCQKPSLRQEIRNYKRLYIVQSFTKFYACAGLRVGALFTRPKNIANLPLPTWNISSFDAAYVTALLKDKHHRDHALTAHQRHYKILRSILKSSGLFEKVYRSEANFILTRSSKAKKIYRALLKEKILVRDCANFDGLDHRYLRFAVKEKTALHQLQKALHALT
ncbi:MAG: aminotransferase class I/II-fold pyridoxal phosphate-dependent enzyme [Sulfurimonadaceae bacterium]